MKKSKNELIRWIEHRTGLETAIKNFFYEEIPASSGWHQVFGSVALFLFLVQAFTGLLLAFNYAPTPGEAYNSLRYIITEITGGSLIRGLHHWGASLLIVVVVLHMVQVFVFGAYKKPREATWMVGVCLLLLTLGYGLTGYLLPWDNRAYWGTVVATQIAAKAPLVGPYLTRLLGSEGNIGVVTFARFFAMHVLMLPPITTLLIAVHVYLVRKHGVAPAPEDHGATRKFYPGQVFRDTIAIFAVFVLLFLLSVLVKVPLERLADPTDSNYVPRPDWYFLFLFQTLKMFEGPLELLGSFVLPTLAVLTLFAVPFLDRGAVKKWTKRTGAVAAVGLTSLGWAGLTFTAIVTMPKSERSSDEGLAAVQSWQQLSPEELAGIGYYRQEQCGSCHNLSPGPSKIGPDLSTVAVRRTSTWMIDHFKKKRGRVPGSAMPEVQLDEPQLVALAAFLQKISLENAQKLETAPQGIVKGAMVFQTNHCGTCHLVNGSGMKIGPVLNGIAARRDRPWVATHIRNPQEHNKESMMPPADLSPKEIDSKARNPPPPLKTSLLTLFERKV